MKSPPKNSSPGHSVFGFSKIYPKTLSIRRIHSRGRCTQLLKTTIINTNWFLGTNPNEGTVTFLGKNGTQIDGFGYDLDLKAGQKVEIELISLDNGMPWDAQRMEPNIIELTKVGDWSYSGSGKVISINPVIIDFGEFEIDTGNWTNDSRLIDTFVNWKIERLDILIK